MRWFLGGFGAGIVLDLMATAVQVAGRDYTIHDAPELLAWYLFGAFYFGTIMGFVGLCVTRQRGPWRWRRPQFRTWTFMASVAYLAFLFAAFVTFHRYGNIATSHFQKSITFAGLATIYRQQVPKFEADARLRHENIAQFQGGKIPEGLSSGQKVFLLSLNQDANVTPAHREYRRGLIQQGEELAESRDQKNIKLFRDLGDYYEKIAVKYDQARLRPWLPVEPDPPMPK